MRGLRGGADEPGGGFAAGITMSIAFILQYMAGGTRWVEERLRVLPVRWIGLGLLLAALTGVGAWLFGFPFLKSYYEYAEVPLLGPVPISSATLFDLGVFGTVVGSTMLILVALAHQSVRSHRWADEQAGLIQNVLENAEVRWPLANQELSCPVVAKCLPLLGARGG